MARIRSIKPDFFTSDTVSALPLRARLTWIGLWTHCDDYGRCRDNVKLVKAAVWPLDDVSLRDVAEDLAALETAGVIYRYAGSDAKQYIQITNWSEHQKVDRPSKSTIPAPDEPPEPRDHSREPREDASSPRGRKGGEGKGREGTRAAARESPPSDRCPEHAHDPDPPRCGSCADARKARERYDRERATQAGHAQSARAREQAETARLAIAACHQCDHEGYVGAFLCTHDPTQADRVTAGAAAASAAIRKRPT